MTQNRINHTVTYMPDSGMYIDGYHESMPHNPRVLARTTVTEHKDPETLTASYKVDSTPVDPGLYAAAQVLARNKDKIMTGQLSAADVRIGGKDLDPLVLVRLHDQLMGEQMRWFHLDAMFNSMTLNQLVYRMSFKDSVASAQEVPARGEYDITKVPVAEIDFYLTKIVTAYDIALEDKLRATIDPVKPLKTSNDYALAYQRERRAARALVDLRYIYNLADGDFDDAVGNGETTVPSSHSGSGNAGKNLGDPDAIHSGGVHSNIRFSRQVQQMKNQFMEAYDLMLTHAACSPNTAMAIAENTWTQPNTIFNVEAYRTNGGTRPFPGVSETTMVISQILPDNVLFFTSKPSNVLVKAEGPKISKAWEDNNKFTEISAQLDFNQYKCAHPDLVTGDNQITRKFGCIALIGQQAASAPLVRNVTR